MRESLNDQNKEEFKGTYEQFDTEENFPQDKKQKKLNLFSPKKFIKYIDKLTNNAKIEDFPIKYACVGCDLISGKQVIFDKGKFSIATRVSSSIPGIFAPYKHNGMLLVDGGVINNIPTSVAKDMGAEYIISIDCIGSNYLAKQIKSTIDVFMSSFSIVQYEYEKVKKDRSNVKIIVKNDKYGFTEHSKCGISQIIKMGEDAANTKIKKIKKDLKII